MPTEIFDTASQPLMRRGDFWLDAACRPWLGVSGRTYAGNDPAFFGRLQVREEAAFQLADVTCTAGIATRGQAEITTRPLGATAIVLQRAAASQWRQRDEILPFQRGDILITDADEPYLLAMQGNFDLLTLYVQPETLRAAGFTQHAVTQRLTANTAAARLAAGFAASFGATHAQLDATQAEGMVTALCQIVAVAAGAAPQDHAASLREARLQQAQRYIARHLTDPLLSPARCAQALGIAVRTLHLAFEPSGETFAGYVQKSRLAQCCALLAAPQSALLPIADIAFASGFASLASFYRAFAATYGAPPRAVQQELRG